MNTYDSGHSLVSSLKMNASSYDLFDNEDLYTNNRSDMEMMGLNEFLLNDGSLMDSYNHSHQFKANENLSLENDRLKQQVYAFYILKCQQF